MILITHFPDGKTEAKVAKLLAQGHETRFVTVIAGVLCFII